MKGITNSNGDAAIPRAHADEHVSGGSDVIRTATSTQDGLLSKNDWNTFNDKQDELTFDSTPTSGSSNPVTSGGIYTAVDAKVDKVTGKQLSTEDFTTALKTKLEGVEAGAQVNVQADWSQVDSTADDFIKNKPTIVSDAATANTVAGRDASGRVKVGTPTADADATTKAYVDALVAAIRQMSFEIVDELPDEGDPTKIYLVPHGGTGTNVYDEYIWLIPETGSGRWELIGTTEFQLTIEQTTSGIKINSTDLQSASAAQKGLLTAADFQTFNAKEPAITKKTAFNQDYGTTSPAMDGVASAGTAQSVSHSDHVHPTDTSRASASDLTSHTGNTSNPHSVTKAQVGLGNADNTSDADKPISTATQNALDDKVDKDGDKVLSDNNYTDAEVEKVAMVSAEKLATSILTPLQGQTVPTTAWTQQNSPDVPGYPWVATIAYTGCTANHFAAVVFGPTDTTSGNFSNTCETVSAGVQIYAKEQPTAAVTVSTVSAWSKTA